MRLLLDARRRTVRLLPEREEDLYFAYLLVDVGDVVRGWTVREYRPEGAREGERVKMYLAIRVEAVEYHKYRGSLRLRGPVVEVQGDFEGVKGRRHALDLLPGREVEVEKPPDYPLEAAAEVARLAEASMPRVLAVSVDGDEAAIAYISALGVEVLAVLENRDRGESLVEDFYRRVASAVEAYRLRLRPDRTVVAGPGLYAQLASRHIDGQVIPLGSGGLAGIYELARTAPDWAEALGAEAVSRLMALLANNPDRTALGMEAVVQAAQAGRIELLLVVDATFRERAREVAPVVLEVHRRRGAVRLLREDTEPGQTVKGLGGIAAILRW